MSDLIWIFILSLSWFAMGIASYLYFENRLNRKWRGWYEKDYPHQEFWWALPFLGAGPLGFAFAIALPEFGKPPHA